MKRLFALVAGGLGLGALLRRHARPAPPATPAADLAAKLAETRTVEEPAPVPTPEPEPPGVDARREDVHARARKAIDELGSDS